MKMMKPYLMLLLLSNATQMRWFH